MPDYTVTLTDDQQVATARCVGADDVAKWLQAQVAALGDANIAICREEDAKAIGLQSAAGLTDAEIALIREQRAAAAAAEAAAAAGG